MANEIKPEHRKAARKIASLDLFWAMNATYATRKTGAGGSFTETEWKNLKKKYLYRCLKCGKKKKVFPDHVKPVSKGGTSDINNIQPLCGKCNSEKNNKHIDYR